MTRDRKRSVGMNGVGAYCAMKEQGPGLAITPMGSQSRGAHRKDMDQKRLGRERCRFCEQTHGCSTAVKQGKGSNAKYDPMKVQSRDVPKAMGGGNSPKRKLNGFTEEN